MSPEETHHIQHQAAVFTSELITGVTLRNYDQHVKSILKNGLVALRNPDQNKTVAAARVVTSEIEHKTPPPQTHFDDSARINELEKRTIEAERRAEKATTHAANLQAEREKAVEEAAVETKRREAEYEQRIAELEAKAASAAVVVEAASAAGRTAESSTSVTVTASPRLVALEERAQAAEERAEKARTHAANLQAEREKAVEEAAVETKRREAEYEQRIAELEAKAAALSISAALLSDQGVSTDSTTAPSSVEEKNSSNSSEAPIAVESQAVSDPSSDAGKVDEETTEEEKALEACDFMSIRVDTLLSQGQYRKAASILSELYKIRMIYIKDEPVTTDTLFRLGDTLRLTGDIPAAIKALDLCLAGCIKLEGRLSEISARCLLSKAHALLALGDVEGAGTLYQETLSTRIEVHGSIHESLYAFSQFSLLKGNFEDAMDMAQKCANARQKIFGAKRTPETAEAVYIRACTMHANGSLKEAKTLHEQGLANKRVALADSHPSVADSLLSLGHVLLDLGFLEEAQRRYESVVEMRLEYYLPESAPVAEGRHYVAKVLRIRGRLNEAEACLREVLADKMKLKEENMIGDFWIAQTQFELGEVTRDLLRLDEARIFYSGALATYRKCLGDQPHPQLALIFLALADVARRVGRLDDAEAVMKRGVDTLQESVGEDHFLFPMALIAQGDLLLSRGKYEDALPFFDDSYEVWTEKLGGDHFLTLSAFNAMGECYRRNGHIEKALDILSQAIQRRQGIFGAHHSYCESVNNKALALATSNSTAVSGIKTSTDVARLVNPDTDTFPRCPQDEYQEALKLLRRSIRLMKGFGLESHPAVANMVGNIGLIRKLLADSKHHLLSKMMREHRAAFKESEEKSIVEMTATAAKAADDLRDSLAINKSIREQKEKKNKDSKAGSCRVNDKVKPNANASALLNAGDEQQAAADPSEEEVSEDRIEYLQDIIDAAAVDPPQVAMTGALAFFEKRIYTPQNPWVIKFSKAMEEDGSGDDLQVADQICEDGDELRREGAYLDAEAKYDIALEVIEEHLGPKAATESHPSIAKVCMLLATNSRCQGRLLSAQKFCDKAFNIYLQLYGEENEFLLAAAWLRAELKRDHGIFDEARNDHEKCLDLRRKVLGADSYFTAESIVSMAHVCADVGDFASAHQYALLAVEKMHLLKGKERIDKIVGIAGAHLMLARVYGIQGYSEEAREQVVLAETLILEIFPTTHIAMADVFLGFASCSSAQSLPNDAKNMINRAFKLQIQFYGIPREDDTGMMRASKPKDGPVSPNTASAKFDAWEMKGAPCLVYEGKDIPAHPSLASTLNLKAQNLIELGDLGEDSNGLIEAAMRMRVKLSGEINVHVAKLKFLFADLNFRKGQYEVALSDLSQAKNLQLQLLGEKHPDNADTMYLTACCRLRLSQIGDVQVLLKECENLRLSIHTDKYHDRRDKLDREEAKKKSKKEEMDDLKNNHTPQHLNILSCDFLRVLLLDFSGKRMESMSKCEILLETYKKTLGQSSLQTAKVSLHLGTLLRETGNLELSYALVENSLMLSSAAYGENHYQVATCLYELAETLRTQGKYLECKRIHEQTLGIRRSCLGKYHPDTAQSLTALARSFHDLGFYSHAEPVISKAFQLARKSLRGEEHALIAEALYHKAENYLQMARFREAKETHDRALEIRMRLFARSHPAVADSLNGIADVQFALGDFEAAKMGYDESLSTRNAEAQLSRSIARSMHAVAKVMMVTAESLRECKRVMERALVMRKKLLGSDHADVGDSLHDLGLLNFKMGKTEQAAVLLDRALANRQGALGSRHPKVGLNLAALALVFRSMGRYTEAKDLSLDSLKIRRATAGENHLDTAESYFCLALSLKDEGFYDFPHALTTVVRARINEMDTAAKAKKDADDEERKDESQENNLEQPSVEEASDEGDQKAEGEKHSGEPSTAPSDDNYEDNAIDDNVSVGSVASITSQELNMGRGATVNEGAALTSKDQQYAVAMLRMVMETQMEYLSEDHPVVLETKAEIADCLKLAGNIIEGFEMSNSVLAERRKIYGEHHPDTMQAITAVAVSLLAQSRVYPEGEMGTGGKKGKNSRTTNPNLLLPEPGKAYRKSGPTLLDQLHAAMPASKWKGSASQQLSSRNSKEKVERNKIVPKPGYMGYQFPAAGRRLKRNKAFNSAASLRDSDAKWLLEYAQQGYKEIFGDAQNDIVEVARILHLKGELERARRNTGPARILLEEALEFRRRILQSGHPDIAETIYAIAETYRTENKLGAAEPLHQTALEMRIRIFDRAHPVVAESLNALAMLNFTKGRYMTARHLYNEVLEVRERFLGGYHPAIAQSLNNLAGLLHINGDLNDAEEHYLRCIEIKRGVFGEAHPDYASALNNLGLLLKAKGSPAQLAEAGTLYQKALGIQKLIFGDRHPDVASTLNNIAALVYAEGQPLEAQNLYRESIDIKKAILGPEHPSVAAALNNLAGLLFRSGDLDDAQDKYEESLRIRTKVYGADHPLVAESLNNIALLMYTNKKYEDARLLYSRALIIKSAVFGEEHEATSAAMNSLATTLHAQGKLREAQALYDQSLSIRSKLLGDDHPDTLATKENMSKMIALKDVVKPPYPAENKAVRQDDFFDGFGDGKNSETTAFDEAVSFS
jgi:hypothetical protein